MTCGLDDSDSDRQTSARINKHAKEPSTLAMPRSIFERVRWSNSFRAISKVPRCVVARVFAGSVANTLNVNCGAAGGILVSPVFRVQGKRAHNREQCKKQSLGGKSCSHLTRRR